MNSLLDRYRADSLAGLGIPLPGEDGDCGCSDVCEGNGCGWVVGGVSACTKQVNEAKQQACGGSEDAFNRLLAKAKCTCCMVGTPQYAENVEYGCENPDGDGSGAGSGGGGAGGSGTVGDSDAGCGNTSQGECKLLCKAFKFGADLIGLGGGDDDDEPRTVYCDSIHNEYPPGEGPGDWVPGWMPSGYSDGEYMAMLAGAGLLGTGLLYLLLAPPKRRDRAPAPAASGQPIIIMGSAPAPAATLAPPAPVATTPAPASTPPAAKTTAEAAKGDA